MFWIKQSQSRDYNNNNNSRYKPTKFGNVLFRFSFGICPHMTEDNKDLIQGKDLLVAYYDVDYEKNAKGSNYWRNR